MIQCMCVSSLNPFPVPQILYLSSFTADIFTWMLTRTRQPIPSMTKPLTARLPLLSKRKQFLPSSSHSGISTMLFLTPLFIFLHILSKRKFYTLHLKIYSKLNTLCPAATPFLTGPPASAVVSDLKLILMAYSQHMSHTDSTEILTDHVSPLLIEYSGPRVKAKSLL